MTGIFLGKAVTLIGSDYSEFLKWKQMKNQPKVYNIRLTAKFTTK